MSKQKILFPSFFLLVLLAARRYCYRYHNCHLGCVRRFVCRVSLPEATERCDAGAGSIGTATRRTAEIGRQRKKGRRMNRAGPV
jgi:hypothetical protein